MPVRVAVVGAGYLGQHHARVYAELEDTELVGVVDTDVERAREVAERYGSRAYSSHREILSDTDALSIVVPTTSHYEVALDCIRAGKDVLIEKPITVTVNEAGELIHEAEKMGCILQVGHLERYNPGVIALSHLVRDPSYIEAIRISPFLNRGSDVDVTLDLMIHDIDVILNLVPFPVKTIRAAGFSLITDKIDEAKAWIEFENGTVAVLTASRIAGGKDRRLRVFQKGSYYELDYQLTEIRRCHKTPPDARAATGAEDFPHPSLEGLSIDIRSELAFGCIVDTIKPEYMEPLKRELKDFVRCLESRQRPKVSGTEGRDALKVALEINSLLR